MPICGDLEEARAKRELREKMERDRVWGPRLKAIDIMRSELIPATGVAYKKWRKCEAVFNCPLGDAQAFMVQDLLEMFRQQDERLMEAYRQAKLGKPMPMVLFKEEREKVPVNLEERRTTVRQLAAEGKSQRSIAEALGISLGTVQRDLRAA
jgi:ATP/maltotriose-dependent transcriptional regulator MalT